MTDQEINEAVARKLGYPIMDSGSNSAVICKGFDRGSPLRAIPNYCRSIAVAWDIINHHQGHFTIWKTRDGEWACLMDTPDRSHSSTAATDTAPMAICLAFLKVEEDH